MTHDYRLGLTTLADEITVERLPVHGALPSWLSGTLIRNGPAMFDHAGKSLRHWFDGQAMLHRFDFADGAVSYTNRLLDTPGSRALRQEGRIGYTEFATDPCASLFGRFFTRFTKKPSHNACVNVTRLAGRSIAVSETSMAVEFDPQTLATVGVVGYGSEIGPLTTAHPHAAPGGRDLVNYVLKFGRHSRYVVYRQPPGATRPTPLGEIHADLPGYVHSFAITERYVVVAIFPLVVNPLALLLGGKPFIENYHWRPELGLRIAVMSLADGTIRGEYTAPATFAFHHINAYDDGDQITMDMCAYPDADVVQAFYLDRLRAGDPLPVPRAVRYRIDLAGGGVDVTPLSDQPLDLPRINYGRHNARPYTYAYGCSTEAGVSPFFDRLCKLDVTSGEVRTWHSDGCYPGEPVFVQAPPSDVPNAAEDDGVVLSVVLDTAAGRSLLLVLDAASFTELARAEVPHPIPYGFHGQYSAHRA